MGFKWPKTTLRAKLWMGCFALALLVVSLLVANLPMPGKQAAAASGFGLDFIAFYRAGLLFTPDMPTALRSAGLPAILIAPLPRRRNLDLGNSYGAFLNPPFFAWIFSPLSRWATGIHWSRGW